MLIRFMRNVTTSLVRAATCVILCSGIAAFWVSIVGAAPGDSSVGPGSGEASSSVLRVSGMVAAKIEEALEAFDSLYDWESNTTSNQAGALRIAERLRGDKELPTALRAEIAALSEYRQAKRQGAKIDPEERARISRLLSREFPDQSGGSLGLLLAAEDVSERDLSIGWAREVLSSPNLPDSIRDRAQRLIDRSDLLGLSLSSLLGDAYLPEGPLALYTWSGARAEELVFRVAEIESLAAGGAALFGLCVDHDSEASSPLAESLPGLQLVWPSAAERLAADLPFLVYRCDANGIIRHVGPLASASE